jgi:hypothetical protein
MMLVLPFLWKNLTQVLLSMSAMAALNSLKFAIAEKQQGRSS